MCIRDRYQRRVHGRQMKSLNISQYKWNIWGGLLCTSVVGSSLACSLGMEIILLIFKSMFMPLIMVFLWLLSKGQRTTKFYTLLGAFFLAWLGDIFIALGHYNLVIFVMGGYAFLFQHMIYIFLNYKERNKALSIWTTPHIWLPVGFDGILYSLAYLGTIPIKVRIETIVYATTLGIGMITALRRNAETKSKYWAGVIGYVMFATSDVILLWDNFMSQLPPYLSSSILLTYYVAQIGICYGHSQPCLLYTSPSPRDLSTSRMPSSA
eukprot:TRINITY_DN2339_c0_g1_i2.p1 TRINITY_DN2339_c0_g1~~TRINITY_DN2339_c0_g1_i2.p1  ORF type:complete len:266 (-),score=17.01 TRINITY_DN2339_c0_g1_i2:105-902(-)